MLVIFNNNLFIRRGLSVAQNAHWAQYTGCISLLFALYSWDTGFHFSAVADQPLAYWIFHLMMMMTMMMFSIFFRLYHEDGEMCFCRGGNLAGVPH